MSVIHDLISQIGDPRLFDVAVAKNHLTEHEMTQLSRVVNAYLDVAEDMAQAIDCEA